MTPYVRDRINRRLDALSDERLYQVLDYIEFLETRYAEKAAPPASALQRVVDGGEDSLRAGGVAAGTVAETMGLLSKAVGVLGGVAQTTVTVATGVASAARAAVEQVGAPAPGESAAASAPASPSVAAAAPAPAPAPAGAPQGL
jgi:hypothetical protein